MARRKIQQAIIVNGPERHVVTDTSIDPRFQQQATVDENKPKRFAPEREEPRTDEENTWQEH